MVHGLQAHSNRCEVPLNLLARCSLSIIRDTLRRNIEIETKGRFQEQAIVSLAVNNLKKIILCVEQGSFSNGSFSKATQGS